MKWQTLIIATLVFLAAACEKAKEGVTFTLSTRSEVTIPSTAGLNLPINLLSPDITTNSNSSFESNRTTPSLVREIKLSRLDIKIMTPNQTTFDFLRTLRVYMSAPDLPEVELASAVDIPADGRRSLELTVDKDTNFKDYLVKDRISLRVQATTRQLVTSDTKLEVLPAFEVRASLLD